MTTNTSIQDATFCHVTLPVATVHVQGQQI